MMIDSPSLSRRPIRNFLRLVGIAALLALHDGQATAGNLGLQQAAIEPGGKAELAELEAYLNNVRTVQSTFVQTASNGSIAEGTLYLSRPDKLRIDYDPPARLQIFGDDFWLIFVDEELKEVNQLPINATPAALLLKDKISLSGDIKVQRLTRRDGLVRLYLTQTDEPDAGRLILTIAESPLSLRGWTVIDAQGIETTVTLIGPTFNGEIPNKVFLYSPPSWINSGPE